MALFASVNAVSDFHSNLSCLLMKSIHSCHFTAHSTCAFWSCSIARSCLFHSSVALPLESLKNMWELLVKLRALAMAPPINIVILDNLNVDVFQQDLLFDEILPRHL